MATERFDLHCHSTASDGMLSPRELVSLAIDRGLSGIAITDHDTVDGLEQAAAQALVLGVEFVPGIELSCTSEHQPTIHLLGYFIDRTSPALQQVTAALTRWRTQRAGLLVAAVRAKSGLPITIDEVLVESEGRTPGRPHVARAMARLGIVREPQDAFSREWLLAEGVDRMPTPGVHVGQAIEAIHAAGGAAVFAHPGSGNRGQVNEAAVREAAALGLDGIEVEHPDHDENVLRACVDLARELDLVQTAGSDDHGIGIEGNRLGSRTVPGRVVEQLRARSEAHRARRP